MGKRCVLKNLYNNEDHTVMLVGKLGRIILHYSLGHPCCLAAGNIGMKMVGSWEKGFLWVYL